MASPEAEQALTTVERLYKRLTHRRTLVRAMNEAYRGIHPLLFASEKFRERTANRYRGFSDNWCAPVANAPNERLRNMGIRLDDAEVLSAEEKQLQRDWSINDMDMQSSQGLLQSLIAKRSFVIVWGDDNDEPVMTWEHPGEVILDRDPSNLRKKRAALKTWCDRDENTEYATLYTPDAVWKFSRPYVPERTAPPPGLNPVADGFFYNSSGLAVPASQAGDWKPRDVADSGDDTWPVPNPLGEVPVEEFANRPMLGSEPLSEIEGVMSMQNAANLLWMYLFHAADHASLPGRVVMGEEPPKMPVLNEQGQVVGEKPVPLKRLEDDRIQYLTSKDARIGQWDAANLQAFTPVIETAVTHIAAQTRTPPHYLVMGKGMVNVSAEGMKAAETGLVMKVREEQLFFTPPMRGVYRLSALVRGNDGVAEKCRTASIQWKDAENHSEAQLADSLLKKSQMGFPFQWIAEQTGLPDTEVARVIQMKKDEDAADPVGALSKLVGQGSFPAAPTDGAAAA